MISRWPFHDECSFREWIKSKIDIIARSANDAETVIDQSRSLGLPDLWLLQQMSALLRIRKEARRGYWLLED